MVKNISCVSYGSLKRFPHTFTTEGEGGGATQKEMKGAMGNPVVKVWILKEVASEKCNSE